MKLRIAAAALLAALLCQAGAGLAADPAPTPAAPPAYPLDAIPDKMPFATPYGAPIALARAEDLIKAAVAEATKHGWAMNIAVVDSGANLVSFGRMDGAQLASIAISEHKARSAAKFRRPTKVWEEAIQKSGYNYAVTLDDVVASRGGIPLIEDGKLIGAIGCSGGTSSQDEVVCAAAATLINK